MENRPTHHSMKRRSFTHDYIRCGIYHVTISVTDKLYQPLGRMAGMLDKPDGDSNAPHVELSPVGQMVQEELLTRIHSYYPMLEVQDYVIMPEHLHFLLVAQSNVVSRNGNPTHLGHVKAGFKQGCNRRYWAMTEQPTKSPDTLTTTVMPNLETEPSPDRVRGDFVATPRLPLFEPDYCDVMPVDAEQLATQRAYIRSNPRSRLLRTSHRTWLQPRRTTVNTAVTLSALQGYLSRECPWQLTPEAWNGLAQRLLVNGGHVVCDSYGDAALLQRQLLPVVSHRKDASLFEVQKSRCLEAAASGAVLVSARIAKGEQEIMDAAQMSGFPVARIEPNGFPEIYHPSADRIDDCASGLLLLLSPWRYIYQSHDAAVSVPFCKTMNCLAQAICRTRDDWWKP